MCTLTDQLRGPFIMKKTIATLIAGLFATAAFAQTPAPATKPAAPASKQAVLVNNADVKASKTTTTKAVPADTKAASADMKAAQADATAAKTDAKAAKASAKHAKHKAKHAAKADTMKDTSDTSAASPAPTPRAAMSTRWAVSKSRCGFPTLFCVSSACCC